MDGQGRQRHGVITRSATGSSAAETFAIVAIATILITRLYLQLTGYPQVGGGDLHIAHALYGGALMMLALLAVGLAAQRRALVFTLLNALVDFATHGFGALLHMSIGLFTLAILSYHLDLAARAVAPSDATATAPSDIAT